jgi:hypothetical protein
MLGSCGVEVLWATAVREGREGEVAWVMVWSRCRCCYVRGTVTNELGSGLHNPWARITSR